MSSIEQSIDVNVPVRTAYNQWTQFEEWPRFMEGIRQVRQLDDKRLEFRAEIGPVAKRWLAEISEQVPDMRIAWHSVDGAKNAGVVTFHRLSDNCTRIMLQMEYDPEGFVEQALLVGTPQGIVGMVLAVVVEGDPIAVVANPPHRGLDVLHAMARDRVDEHRARIIAIVPQRSVEQARERAPVRLDGPKLIVQGTAAEERDGHTHAFEAVARQGAQPIR